MRYFAYGANMDVAAMAQRCPGANLIGRAQLPGYRFVIAKAGFAGLEPDPASDVYGVLWDLSDAHVATLDDYEGVPEGLYRKAVFTVEGGPALVYVPSDRTKGKATRAYLEGILAAAKGHGFEEDYVRELKAWL